MAHDVPVLCAFLLIRPCCRQLQWAGSSARRYLLKWGREREHRLDLLPLQRRERVRRGEERDSFFESLELSETGWSLSREKQESDWMKRCWFFSLLISRRLSPNSSASPHPPCAADSSVSLSWEPVIDLIWPLPNKSLSGITQHASRSSAESCALMLFGWWRERNPAVLLSPVWVQTQPWESQDSLCAALFLDACLPREFA